jgi:alpha-L-fucosidase 2
MMGKPLRQQSYQPIGNLVLEFAGQAKATEYRRELNLDTAIAETRYRVGGVEFRREVFASPIDQVLVVRLTADKPEQLSFSASLTTPQQTIPTSQADGFTSQLDGIGPDVQGIKGAIRFSAQLRTIADGGTVTVDKEKTTVAAANSVTLLVSIATSYVNSRDVSGDAVARAAMYLTAAAGKSYEKLRQVHVAEHQRLFRRMSLDLERSEVMNRPTD